MRGYSSLLFIAAIALICCQGEKQDSLENDAEFRLYNLESQGWRSKIFSQTVDDISYTATDVPLQYYLLKEMGADNATAVDSAYNQNKAERVIEFTFRHRKDKDLLEKEFSGRNYSASVEYISFQMQNDFVAVTGKRDTIRCSGVTFERTFKVSPENRLLLFFSGIDPDDKIQLIYEDQLFGKGILKFTFKEPTLKL